MPALFRVYDASGNLISSEGENFGRITDVRYVNSGGAYVSYAVPGYQSGERVWAFAQVNSSLGDPPNVEQFNAPFLGVGYIYPNEIYHMEYFDTLIIAGLF